MSWATFCDMCTAYASFHICNWFFKKYYLRKYSEYSTHYSFIFISYAPLSPFLTHMCFPTSVLGNLLDHTLAKYIPKDLFTLPSEVNSQVIGS